MRGFTRAIINLGWRALLLVVLGLWIRFGVELLVESQGFGMADGGVVGLVVLAIPLLTVGWLVVRIGRGSVRSWRYREEQTRWQRRMARLGVATALGAVLWLSVQVAVPTRYPGDELVSALAAACPPAAVPGAGSVDTTGAMTNHLVVLADESARHEWSGRPPMAWRPRDLADTELVACVSPVVMEQIQTCSYFRAYPAAGGLVTRYRATRHVLVVEAASGRLMASFDVVGEPAYCPKTLDPVRDPSELRGEVSWPMVEAHCVGLVDRGTYATPSPPEPSGEPEPGGR